MRDEWRVHECVRGSYMAVGGIREMQERLRGVSYMAVGCIREMIRDAGGDVTDATSVKEMAQRPTSPMCG